MLINLIGNAVKFSDRGEILVRGQPAGSDDKRASASRLWMKVRAFLKTRCRSCFSRFPKVDASIVRRHSGTGLGLALCKRLIEAMGGGDSKRARSAQAHVLV